MKYENKVEILRGIAIIVASFFLTGVIVGYFGKWLFLMWAIPLIIAGIYVTYILTSRKRNDKKGKKIIERDDIFSKRKLSRWRIISILIGLAVIVVGSHYLPDKFIIYLLLGVFISTTMINIFINYYYKSSRN